MAMIDLWDFDFPKKENKSISLDPVVDEYTAELVKIADERNYSTNYVDALSKLNAQQIKLDKSKNERENRILEISDFLDKSLPHLNMYISSFKNKNSDTYFDISKKFLEQYYPYDYIADKDLTYILNRYGIYNYMAVINGNIGAGLIFLFIVLLASIPVYTYYKVWLTNGADFLFGMIMAFCIASIFGVLLLMYVIEKILFFIQKIYFLIKNK